MKIVGVADSADDYERKQQDIDRLVTWAQKWQAEFTPDKYEVMHFGVSNLGVNYTVNGRTLKNINIQTDLGVQVHSSLKVATQVAKVFKKAYGRLAFIGCVHGVQELANHITA
eukprot:g24523.t1